MNINHNAIFALYPNAVSVTDINDTVTEVKDVDGNLINIDIDTVNSWVDPKQYFYNRHLNYPSIGDQLDMIFHAGLGGDEFQAAIKAVKDAYPKPE